MKESKQTPKSPKYWPYLFILLACLLLNANTFNHGFVLDDDVVFVQNRFVQEGISGIDDILSHGYLYGFNQRNDQSYRPLVLISYAIEKSFFGGEPKSLHVFNVLFYALVVMLLYAFLKLLFKEQSHWWAFWISLLYLFHPIHTEAVANIKGRDEIFHALFTLLTLYHVLRYHDFGKKKDLILSMISFFLALMCKEMAVSLLALVPLCLYFFRDIKLKQLLLNSSYFAAVLVVYLILRSAILDSITFEEQMTVINNTLAAAPDLGSRIATNFVIFVNYLKLLVFPHPLSWDYSYPYFQIVGFSNPFVILIVLLFLLALGFSVYGLKSKNVYAFTFLFFLISFAVVSNFFILIGATLGERFLFFPSIAFCILLARLIADLDKQWFAKKRKYALPIAILIPILALYGFKTYDRNQDWESNEKLFIAGYEAIPNNSRAVSALASVYRNRGEMAQNEETQIKNLERSLELYLESIKLYTGNTDAFYNLGVVYMNLNKRDKARLAYEQVLNLNPNHTKALNNIGVIYFQQADYTTAESLFLRALNVEPDFQNAHANLGAVYHNTGDLQKARSYYERALQLNPADQNTRNNLNLLLGN
ncbi:MAG: hypothetical protein CMP59_09850 [Flavobacteriales bacterium]|nr:hypothetical protein [Flavobacteriales bacterium]|tara:strand:+ start:53 stop:1828 length:1776 start_codon:yes stop_codon:yes gene_type:complete